eukprot:gene25580-34143_t
MDSSDTIEYQQKRIPAMKWGPGSVVKKEQIMSTNTTTIPLADVEYKRGQQIKVKVTRFGPMGASVIVIGDEGRTGLILQREIAMFRDRRDGEEVVVGEVLDAFVEKVREDEKLDLALRPQDMGRISAVKQLILDALEGSPSNIIPIGDNSFPDDVAAYFHGISKRDFKNAVGSLYKGNFPVSTTVPLLEKTINKLLGKGTIVETRLAVDETGQAKGEVADKPKPWRRIAVGSSDNVGGSDEPSQEAFSLDSLNPAVRKTPASSAAADATFRAKKQKASTHRYDIENFFDEPDRRQRNGPKMHNSSFEPSRE